jgi:hypothetical protein
VDEGIRLGVIVTPAFFIRDQLIVGSFFRRPFRSPRSLAQVSHKMIIAVKNIVC